MKQALTRFIWFLICIIMGAVTGVAAASTWILSIAIRIMNSETYQPKRRSSNVNYGSFFANNRKEEEKA